MALTEAQEEAARAPAGVRGSAVWGRWRGDLGPLVVFLGCALVLHGAGLVGGPIPYERDTTLFYYPFTDWFAQQLRQGRLPFWIPTAFAGYPLLADGEVGPLYPLNLLVLPLLPTDVGFVTLRVLHTFLAGALTYGLLRTLETSRIAALAAGLVFSLGSFMVAQVHHDNMIRSAVWLPGELWLMERAFRSRGWARQRWLVATGLLLGVACLGVHIQAVAMSVLALGLYVVYRLAVGPFEGSWRERLVLLFWAPGLSVGLAVVLAAAQWLPLFELGRTSYRGPGLRYDLATTYSLAPLNLPSLLLPYFFRAEDGQWWSLWNPWETLPYVGIAPLALGALGILLGRRRPAIYFATLVGIGLWIAMAHYAPLLNLHELLWHFPGLSSLRAPARFSYLLVMGMAGLTAFGVDVLARGRVSAASGGPQASVDEGAGRINPAPTGGAGGESPAPTDGVVAGRRGAGAAGAGRWVVGLLGAGLVVLAGGLAVGFTVLRGRLLENPGWGQQMADLRYLTLRRESPDLQPYQVYEGLVYSLDLGNGATVWSLGLLATTGLLLLGCWLWRGRARLGAVALLGLTAVDLLAFGLAYHPRAPIDELMRVPPVASYLQQETAGEHVFVEPVVKRLEPNRLTLARAWDLNGYSSLQSQRHWEYALSVDRVDNLLFDLWNGRYYVVPARRTDVVVVEGTAYRPYELLMSGGAGNPSGFERFQIEPFPSGEVRILAALANAISVPQGEQVAEITLVGLDGQRVSLPLQAGFEVSEHAIDRPDVAPLMAHRRARIVSGLPESTPTGLRFSSNISYAAFSLSPAFAVREVEVRSLMPDGYFWLWGLGLVEPGTQRVRSLFSDDKAKYEHPPLFQDAEAVLYRNSAAFPRAYVVPEALARRTRTETTSIARMALRPFDPRRQVLLEEGPFDDLPLASSQVAWGGPEAFPLPAAAEVIDRGPEEVVVRASGPGVLVLSDAYHRGWRAYLRGTGDGSRGSGVGLQWSPTGSQDSGGEREVPVYLANYVGRAVGLPAGEQTVRFVFDPLSWRIGVAMSLGAALFALLVFSSRIWAAGEGVPSPRSRVPSPRFKDLGE